MPEKLYRYESYHNSGYSPATLKLEWYWVTAETPKGYWISYWSTKCKDKWVSKTARKRYAHPTEEEALKAYKYRKRAYVKHARANLRRALEDLNLVEPVQSTAPRITLLKELQHGHI